MARKKTAEKKVKGLSGTTATAIVSKSKVSKAVKEKTTTQEEAIPEQTEIVVAEAKQPTVEPATQVQILYQRLAKEIEFRAQYMKRVAELQKENVNLRTQLNSAHEQLINMQIKNLIDENTEIRDSVGLGAGDQIRNDVQGQEGAWVRVSQ